MDGSCGRGEWWKGSVVASSATWSLGCSVLEDGQVHEIGLALVDCGIDTECHARPTVAFLSAVEPYMLC